MLRSLIPVSAALALLAGCANPDSPKVTSRVETTVDAYTDVPGMAKYALAAPIHVNNVSIVPVISRENQELGAEYVTLAEAKRNSWIEIIEESESGEVESLIVKNIGPKPILLLAGDLLLGGKQDRVVAKDTIVPTGKEVVVPVYCVEPGRWSGTSHKFSYGDTSVPLSVREEAIYGDQESVWSNVRTYNSMAGAPASDGRTTIQKGLFQEEIQTAVGEELAKVLAALSGHKGVVGALFLVDGEVQTLELFGSPRLFEAAREPLLRGALAEAAVNRDKPASAVDLAACASFMAHAMKSDRVVAARAPGNEGESFVSTRRASPMAKGVEIHLDDANAGESSLVHGSYGRQ